MEPTSAPTPAPEKSKKGIVIAVIVIVVVIAAAWALMGSPKEAVETPVEVVDSAVVVDAQ